MRKLRNDHLPAPSLLIFVTLVSVIVLAGCASGRPANERVLCRDVVCLSNVATEPHFNSCMRNLFRYSRQPKRQAAIDATYGYPFGNVEGYLAATRTGVRGPDPREWCRDWAKGLLGVENR